MAKIINSGNSLAVTVPAKFAKRIGVKAGDNVAIETDQENGTMSVTFKDMRQLSLLKTKKP